MKKYLFLLLSIMTITACHEQCDKTQQTEIANISEATVSTTVAAIEKLHPNTPVQLINRGVKHAASLWRNVDGNESDFQQFCEKHFIADASQKELMFEKVSRNLEILYGHFNKIALDLQRPLHEPMGDIIDIDKTFGGYSAGSHLIEDMYRNKLAFNIALNFPYYSLSEKEQNAATWTRKEWAYARMGDVFTARIPAEILQNVSEVGSASEMYIANYNIYMGQLVDEKMQTYFPEDMVLLSHWNLRDEIKSHYSKGADGVQLQGMVYEVMKRIIDQTIPKDVINNGNYQWNPYSNAVYKEGQAVELANENNGRYQQIINNFHAMRQMDAYTPLNTAVKRAFEGGMEITQADAEQLFVEFMSSDALMQVGDLIKQRLGRDLQPWDIWYDGFKARSSIDENALNKMTRSRYPNAKALDDDLAHLLVKLGFTKEKASFLAERIDVDPARGSGHAWGASMKGETAHLRTRIPESGMDYKGYNIAIHEFGHNVEQTISLYDVDYYMLNGVPNTAFTEALAFIFQKRDLELLDMKNDNLEKEALQILDNFWSTYEIMGVSLLDQRMWKWLYNHPEATADELKVAVQEIAIDIWNEFYAPAFGIKDQPILAIYSHMINSPIYLSNYAFGHLIQFQVEQYLKTADFAPEVERLFKIGSITPNAWMQAGLGEDISIVSIIKEAQAAAAKLSKK
ncbi:hypothetical protein KDU71_13060 [Carboxylicivirga sediminis]|uniref:Uncharacterized protein n=1 Tax=Carboxylicivirga sediminis TaxID=2006564 RepID=A0A941F498_9BACT|nr:hypothetical protein [Carboxylicivirga sediminis]MBR8536496.1 hypothetical protein [Carboxylicivirga sediminis]